jgi:hypothetical protein
LNSFFKALSFANLDIEITSPGNWIYLNCSLFSY